MNAPTLYTDPTSEPCRAVHWFCLEADIAIEIRHVWLARGEHHEAGFLALNPRHQVPVLQDGEFILSEASAIIRYLAETAGVDAWFGMDRFSRARCNQLLSWHHTNLRLKATLNYFLPVLLRPAYLGADPPSPHEVLSLRVALRETLLQLQQFLGSRRFLGGEEPSVADLVIAADYFALDCDPAREEYASDLESLQAWVARLRLREAYRQSHRAWTAVAQEMRALLLHGRTHGSSPAWVATLCEETLSQ